MTDKQRIPEQFKPIEDPILLAALNELSRSINIATTYGLEHPAFHAAIVTTEVAMNDLFKETSKIVLGAFNGVMTLDEVPIKSTGTLLKALERRLSRLQITGLRLGRGIHKTELTQLCELLSVREAADFKAGMSTSGMSHIESNDTRFEAVHEDQTVANQSDLAGMGGDGVLVLDDGMGGGSDTEGEGGGGSDVQVEQIVAFLKGDIEVDESDEVGEELAELASDPARLGKLIMESVAVRQSVSELSGESLGDIVLGCLRRTYSGLRQQPAFQSSEGVADLRKALLMLEENVLDQMRAIAGDADPELDRQIVQAIREMDESLGFEMAAMQYMEHKDAIDKNKSELQAFIQSRGPEAADGLISETDFPAAEWRRIVVESGKANSGDTPPIAAGLNTLTNVFERLEQLMKTEGADGANLKDLLGKANDNLDDTIFTTKEKLDVLSQQLNDDDSGTIGGHGKNMPQEELLAALAEVAQELMQPLTAITASVDMMLQGFVGEISEDQRDLLGLAANSGEHLKFLMKELINIVGCPTNKGVDSRFHTTSDKVIQLRDSDDSDGPRMSYFQ